MAVGLWESHEMLYFGMIVQKGCGVSYGNPFCAFLISVGAGMEEKIHTFAFEQ